MLRARSALARAGLGARGAVNAGLLPRLALPRLPRRAECARCRACGSPRLAAPSRARRRSSIAHVDCDAFYATIEKRDDPALADKPVIVGGGQRGVVATACYVARTYGVRSAMPMFEALRLLPARRAWSGPTWRNTSRVGREVRALMLELTPLVEPLSIDEAFLDLSGTERLHGLAPPRRWRASPPTSKRELGITVSVGLSCNKFLAKIASDLDKPRGFAVSARPRRRRSSRRSR